MSIANRLTFGLLLSGAGHLIHNIQEFGLGVLAGVETLLPVAITGLLIVVMRRRISRAALLVAGTWALVVLTVGGGSVFPLAALPFEPDQSTAHYLTHAVYALLQVPLLAATAMAWMKLRSRQAGPARQPDRPETDGRRPQASVPGAAPMPGQRPRRTP